MRSTTGFLGFLALGALGMGCAVTEEPTAGSGNDELGIARFVVEELADRTTVVGLDAVGAEVGRLDLVHGQFALSPPFTEDYETPDVDGRKLTVDVLDQQLIWETAGYEPVLEMPAHPADRWALAAFLDDPHAKAVLDRWQIGFEPFVGELDGELAQLVTGWHKGDSPQNCANQSSCGSAYYGTINTCGGGAAATQARRVTQKSGTNCGLYTSSYNQVILQQCCPTGSGGQPTPWFAIKACPTTSNNGTQCGTRTAGACKACPGYPALAPFGCNVLAPSSIGSCSGATIYQQWYNWESSPPVP